MLDSRFISGINFSRIVAALPQGAQRLIRNILDHFEQARISPKDLLANVGARLDDEFLKLAVHHFAQALDQQAVIVAFKQRVPVASPKDLYDVPARASEGCLEFLHDLSIPANRAVQPLQVAIDDKNK